MIPPTTSTTTTYSITVAGEGALVLVVAGEAVESAGFQSLVQELVLGAVDALVGVGPKAVVAVLAAGLAKVGQRLEERARRTLLVADVAPEVEPGDAGVAGIEILVCAGVAGLVAGHAETEAASS